MFYILQRVLSHIYSIFPVHFLNVLKNSCSTVFCPIAGCGAHLDCLEEFEDHYVTRHTASCSVCSRVYPTSRLLSIHVSETHDSYFQAKVARGFPMVMVICLFISYTNGLLFYILANGFLFFLTLLIRFLYTISIVLSANLQKCFLV